MRKVAATVCLLLVIATGCPKEKVTVQEGKLTTKEAALLTVGSDIPYEPFEFEGADGKYTGFDVDLVEEIAKRLGLKVKWVDTDFLTIFTQLASGNFDVVASATGINEERKKQVSFTIPYFLSKQGFAVNKDKTPNISSIKDLKSGDTVAVQEGTTLKTWAEDNLAQKGIQIRAFAEAPDLYAALEAGTVTGLLFDEGSVAAEVAKRPALKVAEVVDTGERFGFAVNPANKELLKRMNDALRKIIADGTYSKIFAKYPDLPPGGDISKS